MLPPHFLNLGPQIVAVLTLAGVAPAQPAPPTRTRAYLRLLPLVAILSGLLWHSWGKSFNICGKQATTLRPTPCPSDALQYSYTAEAIFAEDHAARNSDWKFQNVTLTVSSHLGYLRPALSVIFAAIFLFYKLPYFWVFLPPRPSISKLFGTTSSSHRTDWKLPSALFLLFILIITPSSATRHPDYSSTIATGPAGPSSASSQATPSRPSHSELFSFTFVTGTPSNDTPEYRVSTLDDQQCSVQFTCIQRFFSKQLLAAARPPRGRF